MMAGISVQIRAVHCRTSNESRISDVSTGSYLYIRCLLVSLLLPRDALRADAAYATAIRSVCLSVCLSVCHTHVGLLCIGTVARIQ